MRTVINHHEYDTDKAKLVGVHEELALYRKRTGEYFFLDSDSGRIVPDINYEDAERWAYDCIAAEDYDAEFSGNGAGSELMAMSVKLRRDMRYRVEVESRKTGKTMSEVINDCIAEVLA